MSASTAHLGLPDLWSHRMHADHASVHVPGEAAADRDHREEREALEAIERSMLGPTPQ